MTTELHKLSVRALRQAIKFNKHGMQWGADLPRQNYLPPVLKNILLLPPTGNKKHEDIKLMHKSLIQHNSWQIKKQSEIWRNTVNLMQTLTFRLNINEWFKYEKGENLFNWSAL